MGVLDRYRLDGQVAVVTGGGRGLGEGIVYALSDAGAAVVVAARRGAEVDKVAADINAKGGKLSIWVNNAGGIDESGLPDLLEKAKIPAGRFGTPMDIGAAIIYLSAPASGWITGQIWPVTGGL